MTIGRERGCITQAAALHGHSKREETILNRKMRAIVAVCLVLLLCGCQKKAEAMVVLQGTVTELGQGTAMVEITEADPEEGFVSPVQIMVSDELSGQIAL